MCIECYCGNSRATPLINPLDCLENHIQYICGNCGRCICFNKCLKNGLQRWNFPFKSLEFAKMYLRTADYINKQPCGIYKIEYKDRCCYKIFASKEELYLYISKNTNKICKGMKPIFIVDKYIEYENTKIKKLTPNEIVKYMLEKT